MTKTEETHRCPFDLPDPSDPNAVAALQVRAEEGVEKLSGLLTPLAQRFVERGEHLYLVGGPVRDAMLGKLGHDLDFSRSALPPTVQ